MHNAVAKPKRPFGRSLTDFESLSEAEQKLIACAARGETCVIGDKAPEARSQTNVVRPALIRFLALGGDDHAPVHEKGVRLEGAYVACEKEERRSIEPPLHSLDMESASIWGDLALTYCLFESEISLRMARGKNLALNHSAFPGLDGDGLHLEGSLFLEGIKATKPTRLVGAYIAGDLICLGGNFNKWGTEPALACDRATITRSVFLNDSHDSTKKFSACGETRFRGARVGGAFHCVGAQLINDEGAALDCTSVDIKDRLIFKNVEARGEVSFSHANVATLIDDRDSWPNRAIDLDCFYYQRVAAESGLDAKGRIAWLGRQKSELLGEQAFALQPWMHLAKILREQGHFREAAEVDIAREDRLRAAGKVSYPWIHWAYGKFAGYGYRPDRVLIIAFLVWTVSMGLYALAAENGGFAPTSPAIYLKDDFEHCRPDAQEKPENGKQKIGNWTHCPDLPSEYPAFSPFAFSTDLILPVMHLGQSNFWGPTTTARQVFSVGNSVQCWMWLEEAFGWIAALTLGAIAAGLVKRRDG